MEEILRNALCSLKSAGKNGFEGLITDLLSSITNQSFLIAKSGHQGGRDLQSNNTYVECKQYCNDKPPKDILGKITQANLDNPYLDLWLLVSTADISAQDNNDYENACTTLGITYNNLFATSNQKYLEALCIIEIDCFLEFFEKKAEYKESKDFDLKSFKEYCNKASLQDYSSEKEKIKSSFLPANIGFSAFRKRSHSYFSSALQSETSSMSKLRQKLNIEEDSTLFTDREPIYESLENWYREWNDTRKFAVINGEEGNGKSWAVAKWLASKIENNDAPPVIFLNSSDCSSNNLTELLAQQIKRLSSNHKNNHFWQEKIKKWFLVKCTIPKLILVIDGINEYHDANWWRLFISNYQSGYSGGVSLIITSRKNYWLNNFSNDRYLNFDLIRVDGFNDKELNESLTCIGKKITDFPVTVFPMLRKPRYFQLVNDLLPELKDTPEAITPERLCYEDIKKRWSNKSNRPITNHEFENLIQGLADDYTKEKISFTRKDIKSTIEQETSNTHATIIDELSTSDFLNSKGRLYDVSTPHLSVGLGMLLCNEINNLIEEDANFDDVLEAVSSWLEPKTGMDIQANVLGAASIIAFSNVNYQHNLKVALLYEWARTHNKQEADRENFVTNFFTAPDVYADVAEKLMENDLLSDEMDSLFTYAMIKHSEDPNVIKALQRIFNRWLSFVHADGYWRNRGHENKKLAEVQEYIASNLELIKKDSAIHNQYKPTIIHNDHLLGLNVIAFAVISYCLKKEFIQSLVQSCISEFIMHGYANNTEKISWVIRSSKDDISKEIHVGCKELINSEVLCFRKAGYSLLMRLGDTESVKLVDEMPSHIFPVVHHQIIEREKRDPCTAGFSWSKEQTIDCLGNMDGDFTFKMIRDAANYSNDPSFSAPDKFHSFIVQQSDSINTKDLWSQSMLSIEHHNFEEIQTLLLRVSPKTIEKKYKELVKELNIREGEAFRLLAIYLNNFSLLLNEDDEVSIKLGWERVSKQLLKADEKHGLGFMETRLFTSLLLYHDSFSQIDLINKRSKKVCPAIADEYYYKQLPEGYEEYTVLSELDDDNTVISKLSFLSIQKSLSKGDREIIFDLLKSGSDCINTNSLRLISKIKDSELIEKFILSNWKSCDYKEMNQQNYGSYILAKYGSLLPFSELIKRIHFSYIGTAIKARGSIETEIKEYADLLNFSFRNLGKNADDFKAEMSGLYFTFHEAEDIPEKLSMHLPSNLYQKDYFNLTKLQNNQKFPKGYLFDDSSEKQKEVSNYYSDLIKRHISSGNSWFYLVFNSNAFDLVFQQHQDYVRQWVDELCSNSDKLFHGRSFAVALCKQLLNLGKSDGIRLYKTLYNANQSVNVIYSQWLKVNDYDVVLFQGKIDRKLEEVIKERFFLCKSDQEIMSLTVGFQFFRKDDWLLNHAKKLLGSKIPYEIALGLTILGFYDSSDAEKKLLQYIASNDEDTWLKKVAKKSYSILEVNLWARHWFDKYTQDNSNVEAWAAFRLFLKCTDYRSILWKQEKILRMEKQKWNEERIAFLKINSNELERSRDKNIKDLKDTLVHQKVREQALSPWMLSETFDI